MAASRTRRLKVKGDFQSRLLKRIPIGKVVKRDDLFYQYLWDHRLDELAATDQALVILAGIKFCQVIDGHISGARIAEVAKDEKDFVVIANVLRSKIKPESQEEDQLAAWQQAFDE